MTSDTVPEIPGATVPDTLDTVDGFGMSRAAVRLSDQIAPGDVIDANPVLSGACPVLSGAAARWAVGVNSAAGKRL